MATVAEQIQQIYIGLLGRAADQVGATYWEGQISSGNLTLDQMRANIVNEQAEYQAGLGSMTREAGVTELYQRMFERAPEAAGLEYWTTGGGKDVPFDSLSITFIDAALGNDITALANKTTAAAAYTAAAGTNYTAAAAEASIADVDATQATLDASLAATKAAFPDGGVAGNSFSLTSGTDRGADFTGTADNDKFDAFLQQNSFSGGVSNSLSSADVLDGAGGNDTLYAELVPEFFGATGDNQIDVQPRTSNIEIAKFEARDAGGSSLNNGTDNLNNNTVITVDAKNMLDVGRIGSYFSDGDLVIENLTTRQSDGADRNTNEITITMDHTDNTNSDGDASDLTVYFDEDYFLTGQSKSSSQANYWILDELSTDYEVEPLLNIERNGFALTIDGVAFEVKMDDAVAASKNTWVEFAAGLQDAITASNEPAFAGLTVAVDTTNTDSTFNDAGVEVTIPAITITDSQGRELVPTGFTSPDEVTADFDIYGRFNNVAATTVDDKLSVNIELEKVGREGEGGALVVGGKDLSADGKGIEVFNVSVLGDDSKPSDLEDLNSTNNALKTVNIATGTAFAAGTTFSSLTIREGFADSSKITTVNAASFKGDFLVGTTADAKNINAFTATGGGDVTYNADIDGTERSTFTTMTGAGKDSINIDLHGDAVDTLGTSFSVSSGGGNDSVTVIMDEEGVSQTTTASLNNLSINAGGGDDKVVLRGGSTNNTEADGDADFNIDAGEGSDFVHIRSVGDSASTAVTAVAQVDTVTLGGTFEADDEVVLTVNGVALSPVVTGSVTLATIVGTVVTAYNASVNAAHTGITAAAGANPGEITFTADVAGTPFAAVTVSSTETGGGAADAQTTAVANTTANVVAGAAASMGAWTEGPATGVGYNGVLYKASLTVNFAGFEQKVTVDTKAANNFVATQVDINNAIKDAIKTNPELARLLTAKEGTGLQQLNITSTVEGDNELHVTLTQPTYGTAAPSTLIDSSDVAALQSGLVSTGSTSTAVANAAGVLTVLNGQTGTTDVVATAENTDGTDEVVVTNESIIDMGTGANDLVALNSHDDSVNTLDFTANWGKVSVVNFFDDKAGSGLTPLVGDHKLDFTNWLDDKVDPSVGNGNALSVVSEARTVDTKAAATASLDLNSNEVMLLNAVAFTGTQSFANLSASGLQAAMAGTTAYAGINAFTATNATNAVDVNTMDSIIMVENNNNDGEYKVFNVETSALGTTAVNSVTLVGTIDFGHTLTNLGNANLG